MVNILRDERGFSFLEMSFVLAIIGFFMLIGIPNYKAVAEKAQETSCEANRKLIEAQLENYYIDNHDYPTGTVDDILEKLVVDKYFKDEPVCPVQSGTYTIDTSGPLSVTCDIHAESTTTN